MIFSSSPWVLVAAASLVQAGPSTAAGHRQDPALFIRVNQIGYAPAAPKVAVACALKPGTVERFAVTDATGYPVLGRLEVQRTGAFGPCVETYRLDFSSLKSPGSYRVVAADASSPPIGITPDAYAGAADTLLAYLLLNQLGDDRDHAFWDLPTTDSSDYGWGRGGFRPIYPCTGKPQGLFDYQNRSTGLASTAGKYAAAFALGAFIFGERQPAFARSLRDRAVAAYALGERHPGVCQTAPARSPYFYEEENWTDDLELAAALLYALTGERRYLDAALAYAAREPVTPWMGQDTARHYQWYPWHNQGHYELWRVGDDATKGLMADYYRRGLEAVARRAQNGFRIGIPFIWCSNNLLASFSTQAYLYRKMTGDTTYLSYERAALDWLFGANPWGISMVIGLPSWGAFPRDPHSVLAKDLGLQLTGGLVDGPVYRSIFENLRGLRLVEPDEYAPFNTRNIVYHDDVGDYSTNEPIMDGTANLTYLLAGMAAGGRF